MATPPNDEPCPPVHERLASILREYSGYEERLRAIERITAWETSTGRLLTRAEVDERYGSLPVLHVALPTSVGVPLYPEFQFHLGGVLRGLVEAYQQFTPNILGPWSLASYLMTPQPELDGKSPVEWLRTERGLEHLLQVLRDYNAVLSR